MPLPLTIPSKAALRVHGAIVKLWRELGRGLSAVEIASELGFRSKYGVQQHVKNLERLGYVTRSGVHFGIIPLLDAEGASVGEDVRLPHRTAGSADTPHAVDISEHLCVDANSGQTAELTEDVPELGMMAGEIVVIDTQARPKRGDAVAWVSDGVIHVGRYSARRSGVIGVVRTLIRRVH